jgi:hypothetical protein
MSAPPSQTDKGPRRTSSWRQGSRGEPPRVLRRLIDSRRHGRDDRLDFLPHRANLRVRVRSAIAKGGRAADVFLPDRLVAMLKRFWRWKRDRGEGLAPDVPLFANQSRRRVSKRRVQHAWTGWQQRAGLAGC